MVEEVEHEEEEEEEHEEEVEHEEEEIGLFPTVDGRCKRPHQLIYNNLYVDNYLLTDSSDYTEFSCSQNYCDHYGTCSIILHVNVLNNSMENVVNIIHLSDSLSNNLENIINHNPIGKDNSVNKLLLFGKTLLAGEINSFELLYIFNLFSYSFIIIS